MTVRKPGETPFEGSAETGSSAPRRLDSHTLARRTVIQPGMCGSGSLFLGQIGDWTWETVTDLCGTNVFRAQSPEGQPAYLAFYYFHVRCAPGFHPGLLRFGDLLDVTSAAFGFGSESVLTLHRIRRTGPGPGRLEAIDPEAFYGPAEADTIYVENFNRWISRSRPGSNQGLVQSSPADFRHEHLPALPERFSPRPVFFKARSQGAFERPGDGAAALLEDFSHDYPVDVTRDFNGVGLMYFAAYFSIIDRGILEAWKRLGRSEASFLRRTVLDLKVCYLRNADVGAVLRLEVQAWREAGAAPGAACGREVYNVKLVERGAEQTLAIATAVLLAEPPAAAGGSPAASGSRPGSPQRKDS